MEKKEKRAAACLGSSPIHWLSVANVNIIFFDT